jgi:hypothetical protein
MQGSERHCKKCGHRCHCLTTDCKECVNDVCTQCDCEMPLRDLPDSFIKENT